MRAFQRAFPLVSRIRPRLGLSNDFQTNAYRTWELAPGRDTMAPRAIFEESDLAKITGASPDRTIADEVKPVYGGLVRHAPTKAYELHDVTLASGHLFTPRAYLHVSTRPAPLFAAAPAREYDEAVLASSGYGIRYFGHWMRDDLTRLLAASDIGHPVSVLAEPTRNQQEYLDLLGLQCDVQTDAFARRMVVIDDTGQNVYKHARHLRLRALAGVAAPRATAPGVMLLRGNSGAQRILVNEAEVAEFVAARGFRVLDPARTSARELLAACNDVDVVLGVEGSQLSNGLMWMSRTGTIVVIQPPQRFVSVLKDHCDNLGMRYAFVICDARENGGFHLDLGALGRMLDRVSK